MIKVKIIKVKVIQNKLNLRVLGLSQLWEVSKPANVGNMRIPYCNTKRTCLFYKKSTKYL